MIARDIGERSRAERPGVILVHVPGTELQIARSSAPRADRSERQPRPFVDDRSELRFGFHARRPKPYRFAIASGLPSQFASMPTLATPTNPPSGR